MNILTRIVLSCLCATLAHAQIGTLKSTLQLHTINEVTVPYQNGKPVPSFEKQRRSMISLAGMWKRMRFAADHTISLAMRDSAGMAQLVTEAADRHSPYFNDAAWTERQVPGIENVLAANERMPEIYQNGVWYRTRFTAADSLKQRTARLNFYAVNYIADVWLNGVYLGYHEGGYTPFAFDVSSALRFDSANVLVVRVDNIPWGTRKDIVPYVESDWFNYTGIIHDVYLEFNDKISVTRADVVPKNISGLLTTSIVISNRSTSAASVDVAVKIYSAKNDTMSMKSEITADLVGVEAAVQGTVMQTVNIPADSAAVWNSELTIASPKLWSPLKPNLYIMKVTLSQNGVVKDEFYTQFGVRTIKTQNDKMLLNEKVVFLHGVARHEDHPQYGR
ncbi:MAG: beta galactosidase jelly roll domain-containing protein, partial [Bacteroidetes bacterium]|nr:beta galactosidase jelly roll domain-containing protein [Bacteroidota bacterium]